MFQFLAITQAGCRRSFPRHLLHRITTLAISAVVALVAQVIYTQPVNADQASRPNIVLIMADENEQLRRDLDRRRRELEESERKMKEVEECLKKLLSAADDQAADRPDQTAFNSSSARTPAGTGVAAPSRFHSPEQSDAEPRPAVSSPRQTAINRRELEQLQDELQELRRGYIELIAFQRSQSAGIGYSLARDCTPAGPHIAEQPAPNEIRHLLSPRSDGKTENRTLPPARVRILHREAESLRRGTSNRQESAAGAEIVPRSADRQQSGRLRRMLSGIGSRLPWNR